MREHLVAECETRYVLADLGDDASRFDAECERWLLANVPFASADDLVPVADPGRAHRDHELVRRGRSRRREGAVSIRCASHGCVSAAMTSPTSGGLWLRSSVRSAPATSWSLRPL